MYIVNGIAYAGEQKKEIRVCGVKPLPNHRLWLRFSTGETKIYDCTSILSQAAFRPLADEKVFRDVYIDYGVPMWADGDIDISPEKLYLEGTPT